jgi:hypothetical protein
MVEDGECLLTQECPLWVISGHSAVQLLCPLYPPKADMRIEHTVTKCFVKRHVGLLFPFPQSHAALSNASKGIFRYRVPLFSGEGSPPPAMFTCSA